MKQAATGRVFGFTCPLPALQELVRNAIMHRTHEATHSPAQIAWFATCRPKRTWQPTSRPRSVPSSAAGEQRSPFRPASQ